MSRSVAMLLALTSVLTIWSAQPAPAQAPSKGDRPGVIAQRRLHRWNALSKWLQLSDEQKANIKNIVGSAREQARKIRTDTTLTPEQKRQQLQELRRNTRQQIGSVLTPEQREKLRNLWAWRWRQWQRWKAYRWGKASRSLR
ncbi:MAG: hypothetical protein RMM08_11310 [Armatimonadota bacterium]|nr:hypothetical protein [bacterium]MDW8321937.1 hypothetical protein [Armatimonadota bacterium]